MLFRRLAVFRGGWTLTAAEAVVTDTELPAQRVMELLERLVRQSLVVLDQSGGHTRYRMLETLRQYATGKLADAGETTAMDAAHAAYFLAMGEQAETGLRGLAQARWLAVLRTEHANLRAALNWLVATDGQDDQAQRLAGSLGLYWHLGRHLEGREVLRRVMALPGGSPQSRARALQAVSLVERPRACIVHPSAQCAAAARESLHVFRAGRGPRPGRVLRAAAGRGRHQRRRPPRRRRGPAARRQSNSLRWAMTGAVPSPRSSGWKSSPTTPTSRASGPRPRTPPHGSVHSSDGWGLSAVLYHFGWALTRFGAPADAVPVLQEAIDVASAAGVYNTAQWATADLGLALLGLGRVDEAAAYFTRAGTARDQVGDDAGTILHTYGQAVLAATRGDHPAARTLFVRAHDGFQRLGVAVPTGLALAGIAASRRTSRRHRSRPGRVPGCARGDDLDQPPARARRPGDGAGVDRRHAADRPPGAAALRQPVALDGPAQRARRGDVLGPRRGQGLRPAGARRARVRRGERRALRGELQGPVHLRRRDAGDDARRQPRIRRDRRDRRPAGGVRAAADRRRAGVHPVLAAVHDAHHPAGEPGQPRAVGHRVGRARLRPPRRDRGGARPRRAHRGSAASRATCASSTCRSGTTPRRR